jgi:protein phosphatase PTC7
MHTLVWIFINSHSFYLEQHSLSTKSLQSKSEEKRFIIFKFGMFSIPHFKKRAKGGEDASFISPRYFNTNLNPFLSLLVVADGVGGWNNVGVDPAVYSRRLCELISKNYSSKDLIPNNDSLETSQMNTNLVKNLIIKSVNENNEKGSSTVCVLYMDNINNTLYSGYLGDSCYLIARPNGVGNFENIFKCEEQTHGFNIPYQVGTEGDDPSQAKCYKHDVEKDDIVILATDGLWDNIEVESIIHELNLFSKKINSVKINTNEFAKILSKVAEDLSYKNDYLSPFVKRAQQYNKNYKKLRGGKPDDITVIVAQISDNEDAKNEKEGLVKSVKF